jgi:hypothetical protein
MKLEKENRKREGKPEYFKRILGYARCKMRRELAHCH